ncbi:NUDIX hydrolase [Capillimicrobium parvum]|uniref:Methanol dehydrogenase activator n=1 Tax=Capillimicrobium parvum TaxID=2884022 RepID=A0A9E7C1V4_9ACTN|nr:NUDIX hydrolase [Capillimicrobium parvum]UGS37094.1 Methanol dehydrogenase activator [Capillimicrobium parvum]
MSERDFEAAGEPRTVWEGKVVSVDEVAFRFVEDGAVVEREIVRHPGAVATIPLEDDHVWLVVQPRQAVGEADMLEIPAGKLDVEGESPEANAQRELAEEVGKRAERFEHLKSFYTSCGVMDEEIHIYLATGLSDAGADADEEERIEVVAWPLDRLDDAIARSKDSKTLIGLLLLKERLAGR